MEKVLPDIEPGPRWRALGLSLGLHLLVGTALLSLAWRHVTTAPPQPIPVVLVSSTTPAPMANPGTPAPAAPTRSTAPEPTPTPVPAHQAPPSTATPAPSTPTPPPTPSPEAVVPASTPAQHDSAAQASPAPSNTTPAESGPQAAVYSPASASAAYLHNPKPAYPALAQRRHQEGLVLVDVTVSAAGVPTAQRLHKSSGFPVLDQAALEAVRSYRFVPAHRGADAVEGHVVVPLDFRLED